MIMHRVYLEMFSDHDVLPRSIFEYIDEIMNCDDLAICVMVTKFLKDVSWPQAGVLVVVPTVKIKNLDKKGGHVVQQMLACYCEGNVLTVRACTINIL